jgi:hypothetical protein
VPSSGLRACPAYHLRAIPDERNPAGRVRGIGLGARGGGIPRKISLPRRLAIRAELLYKQTGSWQEKALWETVVDSSERIVGKPHLTLQRLTPTTSCGPGNA